MTHAQGSRIVAGFPLASVRPHGGVLGEYLLNPRHGHACRRRDARAARACTRGDHDRGVALAHDVLKRCPSPFIATAKRAQRRHLRDCTLVLIAHHQNYSGYRKLLRCRATTQVPPHRVNGRGRDTEGIYFDAA